MQRIGVVGGLVGHMTRARGAKGRGWFTKAMAQMEQAGDDEPPQPYPATPLHGKDRKKAFLSLQTANAKPQKVVLELIDDICPVTVENFLKLCKSEPGYKGSKIFRVVRGFGIMGGDYESNNGRGGKSAFESRYFDDENFVGRHSVPGVITMANSGVDTNSSVFFITTAPAKHLDGRNVVFGRVVEGMNHVEELSSMFNIKGKPINDIKVVDCGELNE